METRGNSYKKILQNSQQRRRGGAKWGQGSAPQVRSLFHHPTACPWSCSRRVGLHGSCSPEEIKPYPNPTTPIPALQPLPHILLLASSGLLLPPGSPPSSLPAASPSFPSRLVPSSLSRCPRCSRIGDRGRISAAAHLHPASSSPPFPEPPPPPGTGAQRRGEP